MRSRDFKLRAKDRLSGNWFVAIIAGIIASFFGASGVGSVSFSFEFSIDDEHLPVSAIENTNIELLLETFLPYIIGIFLISLAVAIIIALIGIGISVGYAQFNMDMYEDRKPRIATLFSKFGQWKTAFVAYILVFLRVLGGTLLFVIPGIIASYKYALIGHVLVEYPELSARDALRLCREKMRGHKWRLFCLWFSFIGWDLLTVLTLGIAGLYVVPYKAQATAAFYKEIGR